MSWQLLLLTVMVYWFRSIACGMERFLTQSLGFGTKADTFIFQLLSLALLIILPVVEWASVSAVISRPRRFLILDLISLQCIGSVHSAWMV